MWQCIKGWISSSSFFEIGGLLCVSSPILANLVISFTAVMKYSNGDIRSGYFNKTWFGKARFFEHGRFNPWTEFWENGNYEAQVDIFKSVIDNYQGIKVEVLCKVHSQKAIPEVFKAGVKLDNAILELKKMENQEVTTIKAKLTKLKLN